MDENRIDQAGHDSYFSGGGLTTPVLTRKGQFDLMPTKLELRLPCVWSSVLWIVVD